MECSLDEWSLYMKCMLIGLAMVIAVAGSRYLWGMGK